MIRKKEVFKIFEVKSKLNRDYVIINLNINKYIKLIQIEKLTKIIQLNIETYLLIYY